MKTLLLIRHAKSSWKFPELADHDRPLNKRGQRDVPIMANRIAQQAFDLQVIYSSSANRALTFAQAIGEACQVVVETQRKFYTFSDSELLRQIQRLPDQHQQLAVVGHNPAMTEVVNYLGGEDIANVPTAAYVVVRSSATKWAKISPKNCQLIDFDYPKRHL